MSEKGNLQEEKEWILYIDGKKWIGEDLEEEIEDSKYFTINQENPNEILSFSNKMAFKKWADSKGMLQQYEQFMDGLTKARNIKYPKTPGEEEDMRKKLVQDVRFKNKKLREILKEHKIEPHEIDKIKELQKKYDFLHSAWLFNRTNYGGSYKYLPHGRHPKLSWYGWNDRTDSVWSTRGVILCRHTWFRGYKCYIFNWRKNLGWFRNRASSAIVF